MSDQSIQDRSTHALLNYGDRDAPDEFPDRHTKVRVSMLDGRCSGKVCDSHGLHTLLDTAGFALVTDAAVLSSGVVSTGEELQDASVVSSRYMSFLQLYFQQALRCDKVVPINFVHRRSGTDKALPDNFSQNVPAYGGTTGAIANVHADFTDDALLVKLMRTMVDDDDETKGGRFVLVNCWRPLATAHRWPLAVCDASSVEVDTDLYARPTPENNNSVSNSFPESALEGKHEWYYFPSMSVEELLVFKQWDEDTQMRQHNPAVADYKLRGVARQTLHSAFDIAASPEAPARRSLEARFACIWKPKPCSRL